MMKIKMMFIPDINNEDDPETDVNVELYLDDNQDDTEAHVNVYCVAVS